MLCQINTVGVSAWVICWDLASSELKLLPRTNCKQNERIWLQEVPFKAGLEKVHWRALEKWAIVIKERGKNLQSQWPKTLLSDIYRRTFNSVPAAKLIKNDLRAENQFDEFASSQPSFVSSWEGKGSTKAKQWCPSNQSASRVPAMSSPVELNCCFHITAVRRQPNHICLFSASLTKIKGSSSLPDTLSFSIKSLSDILMCCTCLCPIELSLCEYLTLCIPYCLCLICLIPPWPKFLQSF